MVDYRGLVGFVLRLITGRAYSLVTGHQVHQNWSRIVLFLFILKQQKTLAGTIKKIFNFFFKTRLFIFSRVFRVLIHLSETMLKLFNTWLECLTMEKNEKLSKNYEIYLLKPDGARNRQDPITIKLFVLFIRLKPKPY